MAEKKFQFAVRKGMLSLIVLAAWFVLLTWAAAMVTFGELDRETGPNGTLKAATHPRAAAAIELVRETGSTFAMLLLGTSAAGAVIHHSEQKYKPKSPPIGGGGNGG